MNRVKSIFSALDLNSDGQISQSELRQSFERYDYRVLRQVLSPSQRQAHSIVAFL